MIFDYLRTGFKVVVGLVNNNILALSALVALGLMVVWVICALLTSYQFRFSMRARKLNKYVLENGIEGENKMRLRYLLSKMPTEFYRGYTAFERDPNSLPSQYIKRFESLEMEISGGVFNQNKSILKTYTNFIFISLLVLSFGLLSSETLTGYLIAEAFILPLAFLLLSRIIYYVYTAIRQHQYNVAVEDFNEVVDCLDKVAMQTYGYNPTDRMDQKLEVIRPVIQDDGEKEQEFKVYEEEKPIVQELLQEEQKVEEPVVETYEQPVQQENEKVQKIDLAELRSLQEEIKAEKNLETATNNENYRENNEVEVAPEVEAPADEEQKVEEPVVATYEQLVQQENEKVQKIDLAELRSLQEEIKAEKDLETVTNNENYYQNNEVEVAPEVEAPADEEQKVEQEEVQEVEEPVVEAYEQPIEENILQPIAYQIKENVVDEKSQSELVENNNMKEEVEQVSNLEAVSEEEDKPEIIVDDKLENVILKFNFLKDKNQKEKSEEKQDQPKVEKEGKTRMIGVTDNFKPNIEALFDEEELVITPKRGRGRPKKVVQENGEFVIHNDKEFEDALVRAEKLMRKNEEPLSASQTKRIEKQLKELIDAMTKYKEGK